MRLIHDIIQEKMAALRSMMTDDEKRNGLVFLIFNVILGFVAFCMAVVNLMTAKWTLLASSLVFALACVVNAVLFRRGGGLRMLALYLFLTESLVLCGFFCVSGTPEGFSALWTCFIPSFSLTLRGAKKGSLYSLLGFLMVAWLFWTPMGRAWLQYPYTVSFLLRFPMIYLAFYLLALFLETIRAMTQRQFLEAERRYQELYKHDALTGVYNRYGFDEQMEKVFSLGDGPLTMLMIDLDLFKNVNDTYGHQSGDITLRFTADTLRRVCGEQAAVCRWGGEEFAVLVWSGEDANALSQRICEAMACSEIHTETGTVRITVSVGAYAVRSRKQTNAVELVKRADRCLYKAKESGRNRAVVEAW